MVEDTCDKINADPATFNWTTADPTVATVSDGVVYAQGKGDTTVTVTAPDGSSVTFIVAVAEGGFGKEMTRTQRMTSTRSRTGKQSFRSAELNQRSASNQGNSRNYNLENRRREHR